MSDLVTAIQEALAPPSSAGTRAAPLKPTIERTRTTDVTPEGPSRLDAARAALPGSTPAPASSSAGLADRIAQAYAHGRAQSMERPMEQPGAFQRLGRMATGAMAGGAPEVEARRQQMFAEDVARQTLLQQALGGEDARVKAAQEHERLVAKQTYDMAKNANARAVAAIDRFTTDPDERGLLSMEYTRTLQGLGVDDDDLPFGQIESIIAQLHHRGMAEGRYRGAAQDEPGMRQIPATDPATGQPAMSEGGQPIFEYQQWDPFTGEYTTVARGPRTAGTTVTVEAGPKAMAKEVGKEAATDAVQLVRAPQRALAQNSRLRNMKIALESIPKGATGAVADTPLFRTVQSALATYAGIDPGNVASVQAFDKQMNSILLDEREKLKGQGTVSDFESRMLAKPLPSLGDDPRATEAVIDLLIEFNERRVRKGQAFNAARAGNPALFQDPNAFYTWQAEYDKQQPWNADPEYRSPATERFIEMVGGPEEPATIPATDESGLLQRPTIRGPGGRRMVLSEDGKSWEPLE